MWSSMIAAHVFVCVTEDVSPPSVSIWARSTFHCTGGHMRMLKFTVNAESFICQSQRKIRRCTIKGCRVRSVHPQDGGGTYFRSDMSKGFFLCEELKVFQTAFAIKISEILSLMRLQCFFSSFTHGLNYKCDVICLLRVRLRDVHYSSALTGETAE